jgi:hypothetical protein
VAKIKAKKDDVLYVYSMSKKFRVMAIFTTDEEANDYMRKHDGAAVIACYGELIILADRYDRGDPV